MASPFMRAYATLMVKTCHKRGAHAIGGMAAFIPSRRDAEVNRIAFEKVSEDKKREAGDGFDGTWVAHPDLVPVAMAQFDAVLGTKPNQIERQRDDVKVGQKDLLNLAIEGGQITEAGLHTNVSVGIRYIASWLNGVGAAAIDNLMEDAATAEISRSQVWQWVRAGRFTAAHVRDVAREVLAQLEQSMGAQAYAAGRFAEAGKLFEQVALSDDFAEFLTTPAYQLID